MGNAVKVLDRQAVPGGWLVRVEVPGAFVRGDGTFEAGERRVFVPAERVAGRGRDEVIDVLADALDDDPVAQILGSDVVRPAPTRAIAERALEVPYARWRRWQATRQEAQARSMAAGVVSALQQAEDAAWAAYVQAIQRWRSAP